MQRQYGARLMCNEFQPDEHSDTYANLLRIPSVTHQSKEIILRILFIVADEDAIQGLADCVRDQTQHTYLRIDALLLLIRLDFERATKAIKGESLWLKPLIEDASTHESSLQRHFVVTPTHLARLERFRRNIPEERSARFKEAFETILVECR